MIGSHPLKHDYLAFEVADSSPDVLIRHELPEYRGKFAVSAAFYPIGDVVSLPPKRCELAKSRPIGPHHFTLFIL